MDATFSGSQIHCRHGIYIQHYVIKNLRQYLISIIQRTFRKHVKNRIN